jgi:DNA-binding Lrp family transcriptional regulator
MMQVSFIKFADFKLPELVEMSGKAWIYYGEDNLYPNELLRMFNKSAKHNAIVLGKVNYITGNGIGTKSGAKTDFTKNTNKFYNINDLLKKTALDLEVFEGFGWEVHWNALGNIGAVYHVPFQKIRSNKENTQFFIKDWTKDERKEKPKVVNAFNPANPQGVQLYYYKTYRPGVEVYPYPSYIGALNAIETDIEISRYHLSTIKNGMFSSKLINFNQGVPTEEEQKDIERRFKKKFTGSDNAGSIVVTFNQDPAKAPTVLDLSGTELDKHFDILNKKIEQDIFAGHQVTSPVLFGIKTEGQLGGRTEMRDAYEIFKSTYCNDRQQILERVFTEISKWWGFEEEMVITPVEPIAVEFSEQTLLQIAPKEYLLDKLGIDLSKYPSVTQPTAVQNEALTNVSGRQQQQLLRIVRLFTKGQLTKAQAALQLKAFGLSDEDVNAYLGLDDDPNTHDGLFSSQDEDEKLLMEFSACGESKDEYQVVFNRKVHKFDEIMATDAAILDLIQKDKRITPEVIASTLKIAQDDVRAKITQLEEDGVLTAKATRVGQDIIIERSLSKPLSELTDKKPKTLEYKVMYSYEGPEDSRNRKFCARLLQLNRFFSRSDIESISRRLGYSVWDRKGGWWTKPDGERSVSCRHHWKSNLVIKKK